MRLEQWESWGLGLDFVCSHSQERTCERPEFVRATLSWSHGWSRLTMDKVGDTKFWTTLYKLLPILFGPKVIICTKCKSIGFLSQTSAWLYKSIAFLVDPASTDPIQFCVFGDDIENIGEFSSNLLTKEG